MPKLTLSDMVTRARAAKDAERAQWLAKAEALAEHESDFRMLGKFYWEGQHDRDAARRCYETATRIAPLHVWCFSDLAQLLCDAFEDQAGASEVLLEAEENLLAGHPVLGCLWTQLAGHFHGIVHDDLGARRCLDHGTSRATSVDDFCSMARAYAKLLSDKERALPLVARAEELAANAVPDERLPAHGFRTWAIANTYKAIGRPEEARAAIEHGLAFATDVAGCLIMSQAWTSLETSELSIPRRCLKKAETFARGSDDWIAIAEGYHEHTHDSDACRRTLEVATKGASDVTLRRIATTFRHLLDDSARAGELAPRGVVPETLRRHRRPMDGWQADANTLLRLLLEHVSDAALDSIAAADYGNHREANRKALEDLRLTGLLPVPLNSSLHEVAELTRWAEGERVDHIERGLACCLLCLDLVGDGPFTGDITSTLAAFTESSVLLGTEFQRAFVGFVVWMVEGLWGDDEEFARSLEDVEQDGTGEEQEANPDDDIAGNTLAGLYALLLTQLTLDAKHERIEELWTNLVRIEKHMSENHCMVETERGWMNRVFCSLRDEMWNDVARTACEAAESQSPGHAIAQDLLARLHP